MKQEEKDYNENQLGMVLFLYNFSETLDKQREMGGEAFIAKSKEASLMRQMSICLFVVQQKREDDHFFNVSSPLGVALFLSSA